MSVLKLGAHMSIAGGLSNALDRAAEVKSNAVQVFTKNNRQWEGPPVDDEDVTRWNEQMPELGIEYAVSHASYLINLASPKKTLWEKSIRAQKDELQRAHAYGIPHVVLHPGAHTGSGEEAGVARVGSALNRIHSELPECADVQTLLELTAGQGTTLGYSFGQLAEILELVEDSSRVDVCVDTCHALAAGYDLRASTGYEAMMAEIKETIGLARVKCWHFNDSKNELGSRKDRHTHIGKGEIGLEGFRLILNDLRWDGVPMLLETPKGKGAKELEPDRKNLRQLCDLVEDASRIPPGLRTPNGG